jgi:hypothetical protein
MMMHFYHKCFYCLRVLAPLCELYFLTFCGNDSPPSRDATARQACRPPENTLGEMVAGWKRVFLTQRNGSLKIRPPENWRDGMRTPCAYTLFLTLCDALSPSFYKVDYFEILCKN